MEQLQQVLHQADQLYSMTQINQALDQLAEQLTRDYADKNPLLLCVMNGAVITAGHLLTRLSFPLQLDYIHASRYGHNTTGGDLNWKAKPVSSLQQRHVILIEDIFDEGVTLASLRKYCQQAGAASVSCVCLVDKIRDNQMPPKPEYIGLTVPDRYVFGFGMDYEGYWRNAPGIYALGETD